MMNMSIGRSPRVIDSPSASAPTIAEKPEKNMMTSTMNAVLRLPSQM